MIRKHVYYRGIVQGVGFRYATIRLAANYTVTGFVRNMMDGRVEVVVEGKPKEIDCFLADLAAEMRRYIRDTQVQDAPYTSEFDSFDIHY